MRLNHLYFTFIYSPMSHMSVTLEVMEITTPLFIKLEFLPWTFDSYVDQFPILREICQWFFLPGLPSKKDKTDIKKLGKIVLDFFS